MIGTGDIHRQMGVVWTMTAMVFVFIVLRAYTRIVFIAAYGIDDHFYLVGFVFVLAFAILMQIATANGLGQDDLDPSAQAPTTFWVYVAETTAFFGMATSRLSVGLFMLRLVTVRWQRISIWASMITLSVICIVATIFAWAACRPVSFAWDFSTPGGYCIETLPVYITYGTGTVVLDVFFAVLPWVFIWNLNMPFREKMTIAGSLSLVILAAVAGIFRLILIPSFQTDPGSTMMWTQVEITLTMICIGILVCRPLWMRILGKCCIRRVKSGYVRHNEPDEAASSHFALHTVGGTPMKKVKDKCPADKSPSSPMVSLLT